MIQVGEERRSLFDHRVEWIVIDMQILIKPTSTIPIITSIVAVLSRPSELLEFPHLAFPFRYDRDLCRSPAEVACRRSVNPLSLDTAEVLQFFCLHRNLAPETDSARGSTDERNTARVKQLVKRGSADWYGPSRCQSLNAGRTRAMMGETPPAVNPRLEHVIAAVGYHCNRDVLVTSQRGHHCGSIGDGDLVR